MGAPAISPTIGAVRSLSPAPGMEVLTPDFRGRLDSVRAVVEAGPDVFNHNVETVPRLYPRVRRGSRIERSLGVLAEAKRHAPAMTTKSGLMVGLGETREEVVELLDRMRASDVDIVTIGQYLRPSRENLPIEEYVHPDVFDLYREAGEAIGFRHVFSGPFVRSSYRAEEALAPSGTQARLNGRGSRWATPAAAILSGLLFSLAFPPLEWVLLLPLAPVPWLVALAREQSRGRALLSGFLFGLAYWCASIPWIVFVVTHYGGQSAVMGVVCLVLLVGDPGGMAGRRRLGRGGVRRPERAAPGRLSALVDGLRARPLVSCTGGFPWNLAAHALYRHPIWIADGLVWGVYGVGFLVSRGFEPHRGGGPPQEIVLLARRAALVLAAASAGIVRLARPASRAATFRSRSCSRTSTRRNAGPRAGAETYGACSTRP